MHRTHLLRGRHLAGIRGLYPDPALISTVSSADYDNDGDPDLYLGGVHPRRLLRNDGGVFVEDPATGGITAPAWTSSAIFLDADHDGMLDLFLAGYEFDSAPIANTTFRNEGPLGFTDVSEALGVPLYHHDGSALIDVTEGSGLLGVRGQSHGAVFGDFDGDGDIDILQTHLNRSPALPLNESRDSGNAVGFRLEGATNPRDGTGTRPEATGAAVTLLREALPHQGHASTSESTMRFGIGNAAQIDFGSDGLSAWNRFSSIYLPTKY